MKDLKEKTIRGGLARLCAQGANFFLRLGSLMILARLLGPKDFGLVGMVTVFTGVLTLFRDFGLSSAAIQRTTVTEEQISTLFWINIFVGALLTLLAIALAPVITAFYHEPRLFMVTVVLAVGFLFNAAGVQHGALLQRQMRFTTLAAINTVSLIVGTAIAIGGAKAGYGYWALVAMSITLPFTNTVGCWLTVTWIPGRPRRGVGIRSMMRFGGTITLNGLVAYVANNFEKVLLGRYWGVDALGLYGRAYQLINIPTDNLNSAAGEVAFSALSRLQGDPDRLKNYFLKGYTVILALTLPVTVACALFADDMISVFLGPKWGAAAPIFRLLAPTILAFAIVNPLFWLLSSLGLVERSLKMGLVIAPVMILSYLVAVPYGPRGVAVAYSAVMMLWVIPCIIWSVHDTVISFRDIVVAVGRPLIGSLVAAGFAFGVRSVSIQFLSPLPRLVLEITVLLITFMGMLLFVTGQKALYLDLVRGLRRPSSAREEGDLAST
ncbi:lipopolysaccharide biosynthesis protein [Tunturibacter psychrotolerans]|uniref:Lipopolysaccharide biosynthesis protein n=1 Tax=Tunturiibacter psychrotolerans TaxID=3069686 RepID=A0AAU7ZNE6_9BACT